jgi:hypothetical protein
MPNLVVMHRPDMLSTSYGAEELIYVWNTQENTSQQQSDQIAAGLAESISPVELLHWQD